MKKRIGRKLGLNMAAVQSTVVNDVAPAAVGYVAGELLDKQLTAFSKNPQVANAIKIAGGLALVGFLDGFMGRMGIGLAANGVVDLARPALEKSGIVGTGISLLNPGSNGYYVAGQKQIINENVTVQ